MDNTPSTRPWRTLVRIESFDRDKEVLSIVIPGWDSKETFKISSRSVPNYILDIVNDTDTSRVYAYVNIGADEKQDIKIYGWEMP